MIALFLTACVLGVGEESVVVGVGQSWYEQQQAKAHQVEGILDYQSAGGRVGIPADYRPFRVMRQDAAGKVIVHPVYAPGHEMTLALHVGQRIKAESKLVARGEGAARLEELWIGKFTTLGAAPALAFTEVKPIARTNRFQPQFGRGTDGTTMVLRSGADAARQLGLPSGLDGERAATTTLASLLGVKTIDWKTQMVVYVGIVFNARNAVGSKKVEITRLDVSDRGVSVTWQVENTPQVRSPFISDTVLVPRVDGDVTFKKVEIKSDGPQPEKLVPEKIEVPRPAVKLPPPVK